MTNLKLLPPGVPPERDVLPAHFRSNNQAFFRNDHFPDWHLTVFSPPFCPMV
ncbi:MAG TPA: hypothetical protein VFZ78_02675 [Flavisolibacter sp.]